MRRRAGWMGFLGLAALIAVAACGRAEFLPGSEAGPTPSPTITQTPTGTPTATPTPLASAWWDTNFQFRIPIYVVAAAALTDDYAVPVTVDHQTMISESRSLASGDDLRIVDKNGNEVDRVLDSGSAFGSGTTTLWFKAKGPLEVGAMEQYWLYYDDPSSGAPKSDPAKVFAFNGGFEGGNLGAWDAKPDSNYWRIDSTHVHRGSKALLAPRLSSTREWLTINTGVDLADVSVDAWWWLDSDGDNIAQTLRTKVEDDDYETNLVRSCGFFGCSGGHYIAKFNGSSYSRLSGGGHGVPRQQWVRVTIQTVGSGFRILQNGQKIEPGNSDWYQAGNTPSTGSAGLRSYTVNGAGWWIDDVTVRPLVDPEPNITLGTTQQKP